MQRLTLSYGELLDWHLKRRKREARGTFIDFADQIGIGALRLHKYRHNKALPPEYRHRLIERVLFGDTDPTDEEQLHWRDELRKAYRRLKPEDHNQMQLALDEEKNWPSQLLNISQVKTGARWIQKTDRLTISWEGDTTDELVSREPLFRQLHQAIIKKSKDFAAVAARLDNAFGWRGIGTASERFSNQVDCPTDTVPGRIGLIYACILELGSFLEQDDRLSSGPESGIDKLDVDVRRIFMDLIRTTAPWLRQLPTVRELDDQLGSFLARSPNQLRAATNVIPIAKSENLISSEDAEIMTALGEAACKGDF